MAEVSAFVYGWIAGIAAVIIWILYGIDTLLKLMRFVNDTFAHLPGLSGLANVRKDKRNGGNARAGELGCGSFSKFNVMTNEDGLEGLTGSTKQVTPITAGGLCMMSWYGPDGTTGTPVECRLSLENEIVTIYQLLRLGDTNMNMSGSKSGAGPGRNCGSTGGTRLVASNSRRDKKDCDTNPFRSAAGVTVAEHRKGRVSVLNTTVIELKYFNKPKKGAGESWENNNNGKGNGGKSSESHKGGDDKSSDVSSADRLQRKSKQGAGATEVSAANTLKEAKLKRRESGGGSGRDSATGGNSNSNTAGGKNDGAQVNNTLADGVTRPGVDPLFTGRVLIWRTMDGSPLFNSVHVPRPSTGINSPGNSLRHSDNSYGSMSQVEGGTHPFSHSVSYESLSDDRFFKTSISDGEASETDDANSNSNSNRAASEGSVDGQQGNSLNGTFSTTARSSGKEHYSHNNNGWQHSNKSGEMNDMSNWSCVIIKFERARECERWHTLLSGLREARAWHEFAKVLPNPDTINTFLSRFFFQNMRGNGLRDVIVKQIRKKLKELPAKKFPRSLGGQLELDEFLIGTQIPWISDVSEPTVSADGEVGFDFNIMYKGGEGGFTLFFRLALEFMGVRVPHVVFSVKLIELEATVHISIGPPPSKKFWIGGHKPPVLRLEVHQGCASGRGVLHRVLTSLPDLSGIMTNLIKLYLFSDMVLPYLDDFPLPSVVKSPKTSQRDLRVRTFDRRRAAKISSAPVCSSSGLLGASASPLPGHAPDSSNSKLKGTNSDNSKSMSTPADKSRRASPSAAATVPVSPKPGGNSGRSLRASSVTAVISGKATNDGKNAPVSNTPCDSPVHACGPATDNSDNNSSDKQCNNHSKYSSNPSFTSRTERHVRSPLTFSSFDQPRSATFSNAQQGSNGSNERVKNTSALSANKDSNTTVNRRLLSEVELTESEDVLSVSSSKRKGGSSAMHNLRNLLKLKGKDMTRESVSRSKSKHAN